MAGGYRRDHDCNSLRMDLEAESNAVIEVITFISHGFLNQFVWTSGHGAVKFDGFHILLHY